MSSSRPRGAPPGNLNALKHGRYVNFYLHRPLPGQASSTTTPPPSTPPSSPASPEASSQAGPPSPALAVLMQEMAQSPRLTTQALLLEFSMLDAEIARVRLLMRRVYDLSAGVHSLKELLTIQRELNLSALALVRLLKLRESYKLLYPNLYPSPLTSEATP